MAEKRKVARPKTAPKKQPAAKKPAAKQAKPMAPAKKRITFSLDAPEAQSVLLTGSFNDWEMNSLALKRDRKGTWTAVVALGPGRYEYRFVVDGQWRDDPACTERVLNSFGSENCVVNVPAAAARARRA